MKCSRLVARVLHAASPVLAMAALAGGCTGAQGLPGASGASCTVEEADGGVVVRCDDGTELLIPAGSAGVSCTVMDHGGGEKMIQCDDGTEVTITDGVPGDPGEPGDRGPEGPRGEALRPNEDLPGLVLTVLDVSGASGEDGTFQVGDSLSVTFALAQADGRALQIEDLDGGGALVTAPTLSAHGHLHTQRVIERQTDVVTSAVDNLDGTFTYTFPVPIPAGYLAPYNDSLAFTHEERTGEPLEPGTFSIGIDVHRDFFSDQAIHRDMTTVVTEVLFAGATEVEVTEELVTDANCNNCHGDLRAHGFSKGVRHCLLCHTTGAEDLNDPDILGGTPGVMITFPVLMHRIHNGAHLPSVVGVGTLDDGTRDYDATPTPLVYVGGDGQVHDYSAVAFPVRPASEVAMPRDRGYTALTPEQQARDDEVRRGITTCAACHGDPDGAGPLPAPEAGDEHKERLGRTACGACHDDIDWENAYIQNTDVGQLPQGDDDGCVECHPDEGDAEGVSMTAAHLHPLLDPAVNPGLVVDVSAVGEGAGGDADGTIDPGERVAVTFRLLDDTGAEVAPGLVADLQAVVTGPTYNRNLLLSTQDWGGFPAAALVGDQPFTMNLPQGVLFEHVGDATAAASEVFATARTPHWNVTGGATTVQVRTATSSATTLAAAAPTLDNYADVASAAGFARNDYLVIDDGVAGLEEYAKIALVDGTRLWLTQPLRQSHGAGATVTEVTFASKTVGTDYTLDAATGQITEVTEFGDGNAVVVSYTTDFVMPAVYPPPKNDSPDLDESAGKWEGLPIVDGTYTVGLWGSREFVVSLHDETNTYRSAMRSTPVDFLVGAATEIVPYAFIESAAACDRCHGDLVSHGGRRRGAQTCLLCHGNAGQEDRPRYATSAAHPTPGVVTQFRMMLHSIHRGAHLESPYEVASFSSPGAPASSSTFDEVLYPIQPGGESDCATCHGASTPWDPVDRNHPGGQASPTRSWGPTCGSCHDADAAQAHIDGNTVDGVETCEVCHGEDREAGVESAHHVPR